MKIFDKILLTTAAISLTGIILILFTGELSSEYSNQFALPNGSSYPAENQNLKTQDANARLRTLTTFDASASNHQNANQQSKYKVSENEIAEEDTMVIYSDDVDEIIETYFKSIRENPNLYEEENRLIEQTPYTRVDTEEESIPNEKTPADEGFNTSQLLPSDAPKDRLSIQTHVVAKGESLWRISQKYNVPIYTIVSLNPESANRVIRPGDTLRISNVSGLEYKVKKGDTLSEIAGAHKLNPVEIKKWNQLESDVIQVGQSIFLPGAKQPDQYIWTQKNRFIWPVSGRITSKYGNRKHPVSGRYHMHTGLDIAAKKGTTIKAAANGVVLFSGDGGTYGNMVVIRHQENYITVYAHASKLIVKKGQYVKQGQKIAEVGSTGVTTGNHLHFEVKKSNSRIDPLNALNEKIKVKTPIS